MIPQILRKVAYPSRKNPQRWPVNLRISL